MNTPNILPNINKVLLPNINKVLLILEKNSENVVSTGGLFLPTRPSENKNRCRVLEVGPKLYDPEGEIVDPFKPGDIVFIGEFAGVRFEHDNQEFIMIDHGQILGKLN